MINLGAWNTNNYTRFATPSIGALGSTCSGLVWWKTPASDTSAIRQCCGFHDATDSGIAFLWKGSGNNLLMREGNGTSFSDRTFLGGALNTLHGWGFRKDGSNFDMLVNGSEDSTTGSTVSIDDPGGNADFGDTPGAADYSSAGGSVGHWFLWQGVSLSDGEYSDWYNNYNIPAFSNLVWLARGITFDGDSTIPVITPTTSGPPTTDSTTAPAVDAGYPIPSAGSMAYLVACWAPWIAALPNLGSNLLFQPQGEVAAMCRYVMRAVGLGIDVMRRDEMEKILSLVKRPAYA